jgi:hypothetical protein
MNLLKISLLLFVVLMGLNSVNAQTNEVKTGNRIYFEGQVGISHLLNNKIDEELNNGFNIGTKFRFELAKRKLSIAPCFAFRQFVRKSDYSDSQEYLLTLVKPGFQVGFMLFESKNQKLQFFNFCEFNYTFSAYDFRYEDNSYRPDGVPNKDLIKILSGKGLGLMLGYRIKYHFVYLEMSYDIYGSKHYFSDEAKDLFDQESVEYEDGISQGINALNINIGFSIPLIRN